MLTTTEIEIAAFVGAIIGALIGLLAPFYNKKKELGWNDIDIVFDKAFLKATVVAVILAVIGVGGSFPIILANVPPTASILTTIITSAVLAITLHLGGNMIIGPSKVTLEATQNALERNMIRTNERIINATNKLREANDQTNTIHSTTGDNNSINFGTDCDCQKCKDNKEVDDGYTTIS